MLYADDAMQLISQDPSSCRGMVSGWINVNRAKSVMILAVSATRDATRIDALLTKAVQSYEAALEQFQQDDTSDGPYGFNYAALKLVSVLMVCDDMFQLVQCSGVFREDNLHRARQLIDEVEYNQVTYDLLLADFNN